MFGEHHWCDVFDYLRFNFKTQDFVMRLPIKATGMKNLEKVVCVHIKCAPFSLKKVRFARAEQLWCHVIKHTDVQQVCCHHYHDVIDTVVKRGICYDRSVRRSVCQLHPWATPISKYVLHHDVYSFSTLNFAILNSGVLITPNECVKEKHFSVDSENLTTAITWKQCEKGCKLALLTTD